ncbi:MAG: CehA/McbA family metallohydrolase [Anaerolineae bacterium]|nr:CehA/McbA family metallohydrolase [Anaerolineae bacterium]
MHTPYSDGTGSHAEIARAAAKAGLDAVIVTDHNIWVQEKEGYSGTGSQRVLVLVGEEIHDTARDPEKNHLLVFGAERELAGFASDPQELISSVNQAGGMAFIAHPVDPASPTFGESDLSWVSWEANGYTGIELWNALSEFKGLLKNRLAAVFYAFNFPRVGHGPFPKALHLWDELLEKGRPVVAVGGSDAHQLNGRMGPISRVLFPYETHFRAVNTHLLLPEPLSGELAKDKALIYAALRQGHAFIGYDLPAPTRGFRFTAHYRNDAAVMGDTISAKESITLQVKLPDQADCYLLKNGEVIQTGLMRDTLIHQVKSPGVYRVEVYRSYLGKKRAWIISNPIYIRS